MSQENCYRQVAALVLVSVLALAGCGKTEQPSHQQQEMQVASIARAPLGVKECKDVQDVTLKGPHGYYCVSPGMMGQSLCLRLGGNEPMHVRELQFPPNHLPEGLMTRYIKQGTPVDGYATVEITPHPPAWGASCSRYPISFIHKNDRIRVLPKGNDLILYITDQNEQAAEHFPKEGLVLSPDPKGGNHYWTTTSDNIDFFVMLADDNAGDPQTAGVNWIERYIYIEAYEHDQSHDPDCAKRRPDQPGNETQPFKNFYVWNGMADMCPIAGGRSQNGSGAGGHDYP